jgi:hypothetical protein
MPIAERVVAQLQSRRPRERHWLQVYCPPTLFNAGTLDVVAWQRGSLCVISALDLAEYPDGDGAGPQWHVSTTGDHGHRRVTDAELLHVRRAFGMLDAEEDNHHPGAARHLFLVCDPARRVSCECKVTEVTIVERDGYQWTNPTDAACRGCELQLLMPHRRCPLHSKEVEHGT